MMSKFEANIGFELIILEFTQLQGSYNMCADGRQRKVWKSVFSSILQDPLNAHLFFPWLVKKTSLYSCFASGSYSNVFGFFFFFTTLINVCFSLQIFTPSFCFKLQMRLKKTKLTKRYKVRTDRSICFVSILE